MRATIEGGPTRVISARLELVRLVREHCTQVSGISGTGSGDVYVRDLAKVALDVPVETMAEWFQMSETVMANIRLAMTMVAQNLQAAEAHARVTGSIACTHDGVTWTR